MSQKLATLHAPIPNVSDETWVILGIKPEKLNKAVVYDRKFADLDPADQAAIVAFLFPIQCDRSHKRGKGHRS